MPASSKPSPTKSVVCILVSNVKKLQVRHVESIEELSMNFHSKSAREEYNRRMLKTSDSTPNDAAVSKAKYQKSLPLLPDSNSSKRESVRWPFLDSPTEATLIPMETEDSLFMETVYENVLGKGDATARDIPIKVVSGGQPTIVEGSTHNEGRATFFNDDADDDDGETTFFNDDDSEIDESEGENSVLHHALQQLFSAQFGHTRKRFRQLEASLDNKAKVEFVTLCREQKHKRYDPTIYTPAECREQHANFRQQLNNLRIEQDKQSDVKREDLVRELLMEWDAKLVEFLRLQDAAWSDVKPLLEKTQKIDLETLEEIQREERHMHLEAQVETNEALDRLWRLRFDN